MCGGSTTSAVVTDTPYKMYQSYLSTRDLPFPWLQNYVMTLAQQLKRQRLRPSEPLFGKPLTEQEYSAMSDQQVAQLFELFKEMQKPRDPDDPLGVTQHPLATHFKDS